MIDVITEQANPPLGTRRFSGHRMFYARNDRTVTYALGQTWDDPDPCTAGTQVTYAYEFRYDGARQRYLTRKYDPAAVESGTLTVLSETWSNYDGDANHDEITRDAAGAVTARRSHMPGLGRFDWDLGTGLPDETTIRYLRNDMIGTTRNTANIAGNPGTMRVKTAFGEPISGPTDRYGYAGSLGLPDGRRRRLPIPTRRRPLLRPGHRAILAARSNWD